MNKHATPASGPQRNLGMLATLLPELLERILSFTDAVTKLQMNRACKELHAALLGRTTRFNGKEPMTRLCLRTAVNPEAATRALQMAAHAAHAVTLMVHGRKTAAATTATLTATCDSNDHAWLDKLLRPWFTGAATSSVATAAAADAMSATEAVTAKTAPAATVIQAPSLRQIRSVHLLDMKLIHPFPACIAQSFSELQHYTLEKVQWPLGDAMLRVCMPKVKSLNVYGYESLQMPLSLGLTQFPALTNLSVMSFGGVVTAAEHKDVIVCCVALSQQLTCLEIHTDIKSDTPVGLGKMFREACYPQLSRATISGQLNDVEFSALLSGCPNLKQLSVESLLLKEGHGATHTGLEKLSIRRWEDGLASLCRLPCTPAPMNVQLNQAVDLSLHVDAQAVADAMARVHLCQQDSLWLQCTHARDWESSAISNLRALSPLLLAAHTRTVRPFNGHVSAPLLAALSLIKMPSLEFRHCTWKLGVAADFWLLVPYVRDVSFTFLGQDCLTACQDQVILVCCTPTRPVTVHVQSADIIVQQRIRRAIQAAGKEELVTLKF